jgi:hypothetical protein
MMLVGSQNLNRSNGVHQTESLAKKKSVGPRSKARSLKIKGTIKTKTRNPYLRHTKSSRVIKERRGFGAALGQLWKISYQIK